MSETSFIGFKEARGLPLIQHSKLIEGNPYVLKFHQSETQNSPSALYLRKRGWGGGGFLAPLRYFF